MIIHIPGAQTESVNLPAIQASFDLEPPVLVKGEDAGSYSVSTRHGVSLVFGNSDQIETFGRLLVAIAHTARYHELEFQLERRP